MNLDLINVILNAGTLLVSIIALRSINLAGEQLKSEHEKGRREKACEMTLVWTKEFTKEMELASNIVEKFSTEQCKSLYLCKDLKVSE